MGSRWAVASWMAGTVSIVLANYASSRGFSGMVVAGGFAVALGFLAVAVLLWNPPGRKARVLGRLVIALEMLLCLNGLLAVSGGYM